MGLQHRMILLVATVMLVITFPFSAGAKAHDTVLADVISLQLGIGNYVIGEQLNAARKKAALQHPAEGAYEGTYKFVDNGLYVVVDKKTDRVLALYKQNKAADKKQLKAMVVELMGLFGAPTTMAHDKILYWAKEAKQTPGLGIVATVKLNSEMEITPDPVEEKKAAAEKTPPATGTIYFIVTSDPLVKEFMAARQ